MRTEEKEHLFAGTEFRRAFNVGVQVLEFSAGLTHDDFLGEIALVMSEGRGKLVLVQISPFSMRVSACMQRTRAME